MGKRAACGTRWLLSMASCKNAVLRRKKCGHVTPKLGTAERQIKLRRLRRLTFAASTNSSLAD